MKRDEVEQIFPDATKEQIDQFLNAVGGELNPLKKSLADVTKERDEAKTLAGKAEAENKSLTAKVDELNEKVKSGMSAEEQLEQLQKETAEEKRAFQLKANALDAKAILLDGGIPAEQCEELIEKVVSEDADKTKALAESIVAVAEQQKSATEQATKDALLKANPLLGGSGGGDNVFSKEQFDKLSYKEQAAMLEENPGLLQSFAKNGQ